jgi:hypothetical protein
MAQIGGRHSALFRLDVSDQRKLDHAAGGLLFMHYSSIKLILEYDQICLMRKLKPLERLRITRRTTWATILSDLAG